MKKMFIYFLLLSILTGCSNDPFKSKSNRSPEEVLNIFLDNNCQFSSYSLQCNNVEFFDHKDSSDRHSITFRINVENIFYSNLTISPNNEILCLGIDGIAHFYNFVTKEYSEINDNMELISCSPDDIKKLKNGVIIFKELLNEYGLSYTEFRNFSLSGIIYKELSKAD